MKRVLKWSVPVDDQPHEIGGGRVTGVACISVDEVLVWTEEHLENPLPKVPVTVVGTGHQFNSSGTVVGTVVAVPGRLVWHVVRYG